jgi:Family of unknown function (DUF6356)
MDLSRAFTDHPASVGESYGEHLGRAACFGTRMVFAGFACLIHGVFPFLFVRTGSRAISELNDRMTVNRRIPPVIATDKRLPL